MAKKKLLLDECVPQRLREHFADADPYTVAYMKWDGIKNGKLLTLAVENGFDIFLTTDKNLAYQQNITQHKIAIVVLDVPIAKMKYLVPLVGKVKDQLNSFAAGKVYEIS